MGPQIRALGEVEERNTGVNSYLYGAVPVLRCMDEGVIVVIEDERLKVDRVIKVF